MADPIVDLAAQEQELRIAKLRDELDALRATQRWNARFGRWLPALSALVPAVALLVAVFEFSTQQNAARAQTAAKAIADSIASERAFMTPVLERQLAIYLEATTAAAEIASSLNAGQRAKAIDDFRRLYWGPLVMFESREVSAAMIAFGNCLPDSGPACPSSELRNRSLVLASALQTSYFSSWHLSPAQYAERSIDYARTRDSVPK